MTDELLKEMKEAKNHDVVPVEFNGGHRKEIEVRTANYALTKFA